MALERTKNNEENNEEVGPYTRSLEEELSANPLMYYNDPTAVQDPGVMGVVPPGHPAHFQHLQHNIEAEAASILTQKQQQQQQQHLLPDAASNNRRRSYNQRKQCVIATTAHVFTHVILRPTLTNNDIACNDSFATILLHTQSLSI